jgi:hypothetical protein
VPTHHDSQELLRHALIGYEEHRKSIVAKIAEIRAQLEGTPVPSTAPESAPAGRRPLSAAARNRMAAGQRKRWAAKRGEQSVGSPAKGAAAKRAKVKRVMGPEAKARIAEAQRKRWAAVRKTI